MYKMGLNLLAALALLYLVIPFVPTQFFIKPTKVTVDGNVLQFYRDVTIPMRGDFRIDVTRGAEVLPECSRYGSTLYEDRQYDDPVVYTLPCELTDGVYSMTLSIAAISPFGSRLRPVSTSVTWTVGETLEDRLLRTEGELQKQQILLDDTRGLLLEGEK